MSIKKRVALGAIGITALSVLTGLVITGWKVGWGPFTFLQFNSQERAIVKKYNPIERNNEIVFYGASNFRLWTEMEKDLSDYYVQNHGFGGSTDNDLVARAERLLYPYNPAIVVFQTGSNDYVSLSGNDDEKVSVCIAKKRQMFEKFHTQLPEAKFIVMSGLLLPGRSQYTELTQKINQELQALCEETDYLYFVDSSSMTFNGQNYAKELFVEDGIHLNHEGQMLWCENYIQPALELVIEECGLEFLKK